jgi:hypothetical protein
MTSKYGKILSVECQDSERIDGDTYKCITIKTDFGGKVKIGITTLQDCCEVWGLNVHTESEIEIDDEFPDVEEGLTLLSVKWGHNPIVDDYDNRDRNSMFYNPTFYALVNLTIYSELRKCTVLVQIIAHNMQDGCNCPHDVKWLDYEDVQQI